MRSTIVFACLAISTAIGCSRNAIPEKLEAQMDEVIKAVMRPSAWREKADAIFADIATLPDKQLKIACLRKFSEKALTIDLSSPGMKNPRWSASDVNRLCREKIIYQIQKSGGTVDDAWDVLISLLSWHRAQADKTVILHMTEKRFQTNEIWIWDGKVDESRIPVLKKRLEKFLGRSLRTLEQCNKDWSEMKSQMRPWPR